MMECCKCPISLACYANKLNHSVYYMYLCPICEQLIVKVRTTDGTKRYAVHCKERKVTPAIRQKWLDPSVDVFILDGVIQMTIKDPKNTYNYLTIRQCAQCTYTWIRL